MQRIILTSAVLAIFMFVENTPISGQTLKSWEDPLPSGPMNDEYQLTADSQRQEGVPQGKVFSIPLNDSKIFPGTQRNISVYVPAQYKADKAACVYVGLDGLGFHVPTVFDNLIHKGEIPVLIGIGIASGTVPSVRDGENPRFNRSFEFDGLNDNLCRFLLEEVFPLVESQKTPDGLEIKLSKDPNERCAGGGSTGGIGAFTLAWERPDQFRRVFSAIGTFVGMRGGDRYPVLVRKTEPKPIRVFLQDGHYDQWGGGPEVGDWWIGNVALNRSLEFSGYDVKHDWGTGPHSGRHADAIFPDVMRWIWRDWPEPILAQTDKTQNVFLKQILDPAENWIPVVPEIKGAKNLAVGPNGDMFCRDAEKKLIYRLDEDGETAKEFASQPGEGGPFFFDSHGMITAADTEKGTGNHLRSLWTNALSDFYPSQIAFHPDGGFYYTEAEKGRVLHVKPNRETSVVAENLDAPTGIAVTPDGLWLAVIESRTHWGRSYRIGEDGKLEHGQRFYWFHVPDRAEDLGSGDCCFDKDGRLYVATRMGVMVLDRNGRTRAILPSPVRGGQAEVQAVRFGGENFDTLYIVVEGKIYKRKFKAQGSPPAKGTAKLPGWGAG